MTKRWAFERRQDFIEDHLIMVGTIRRRDLMDYFRISTPQAAADIRAYLAANKTVTYDKSLKTYRLTVKFKPVRGSTPERRECWQVWAKT